MTTLPLTEHPVVREAAAAMAREWYDTYCRANNRIASSWSFDKLDPENSDAHIAAHACLLCDLSRPASRDWWVRFGADRECAACSDEWAAKATDSTVLSGVIRKWVSNDHSIIRAAWRSRCDNPQALAAAILAAVERA